MRTFANLRALSIARLRIAQCFQYAVLFCVALLYQHASLQAGDFEDCGYLFMDNPSLTACARVVQGDYPGDLKAVAHVNLATEHFKRRRFDRAIQEYTNAIRLTTDNPSKGLFLGFRAGAMEVVGQTDAAIADLNQAMLLNPDQAASYRKRRDALISQQQPERQAQAERSARNKMGCVIGAEKWEAAAGKCVPLEQRSERDESQQEVHERRPGQSPCRGLSDPNACAAHEHCIWYKNFFKPESSHCRVKPKPRAKAQDQQPAPSQASCTSLEADACYSNENCRWYWPAANAANGVCRGRAEDAPQCGGEWNFDASNGKVCKCPDGSKASGDPLRCAPEQLAAPRERPSCRNFEHQHCVSTPGCVWLFSDATNTSGRCFGHVASAKSAPDAVASAAASKAPPKPVVVPLTAEQAYCAAASATPDACRNVYRRCAWNETASPERRCWPRPDPLPPSLAELPFVVWSAVSTYASETWPRVVAFVVEQQTPLFFCGLGLALLSIFAYRKVAKHVANAEPAARTDDRPTLSPRVLGNLRAALRQAAGDAPPTSAPKPRDTPAALAAMELAHAYLSEVEQIDSASPNDATGLLNTLSLTAKQLKIADAADPDAIAEIVDDDGENLSIPLSALKARALYREALIRHAILQQHSRALSCLNRAVEIAPIDANCHALLGVIHSELLHKGEAIAAFERALALDPKNVEWRKGLDRARNISGAARAIKTAASVGSATSTLVLIFTGALFVIFAAVIGAVVFSLPVTIVTHGWSLATDEGRTIMTNLALGAAAIFLVLYFGSRAVGTAVGWFLSLFLRRP